jgi:glycosyltransferase involved in cell wall biosynthesis
LIRQEDFCLNAADLVITPSRVTKEYLQSRAVPSSKIRVIPNGVDLNLFKFDAPASLHSDGKTRMLYFGTLSAWQGVEHAVALLADPELNLELRVIGAGKVQQIEELKLLAAKMNVSDRLAILPVCSQQELVAHLHSSHLVLALLSANDRNLVQGCCPFKIIEAMAAGRPLLSTSLPVVHEISGDEPSIFTAKAGSIGSLRDTVKQILSSPEESFAYAARARRRIEETYNLECTTRLLTESYEDLLNASLSNSLR